MRIDGILRHQAVPLELPASASCLHVAFMNDALHFDRAKGETSFTLKIPKLQQIENVTLTFDAYVFTNPVHPEGHLGWWTVGFKPGDELKVTLVSDRDQLEINSSQAVTEKWIGVPFSSNDTILLQIVLRHPINNAIVSQQSMVVYSDQKLFEKRIEKCSAYIAPQQMYIPPDFGWPRDTKIHIVASSLPRFDYISHQPAAVLMNRQLKAIGIDSQLYAHQFDPELRGAVLSTKELLDKVSEGDLVFVLYSGHEPNISWLAELDCKKALFNFGVPYSASAQAFDAEFHRSTQMALEDYSHFSKFQVLGCASRSLKKEMRKSGVSQNIIIAEEFTNLHQFWSSVIPGEATEGAFPVLVYPGTLDPYNDMVATLEVFEYVKREAPNATLFAASSSAWRVYEQYILHLLATRFRDIKESVQLRTGATDSERKVLISQCDALIDIGVSFENHVETALHFGKDLFTSAHNSSSSMPSTFRLYGSLEEKANQVVRQLSHRNTRKIEAENAQSEKKFGKSFWGFLEVCLRSKEIR